ncbi:MAG: hypothetical protein J7513_03690 [Solirubrobacteraceae bacterium]|nr:hypothetical protein [Solirubrobacteraceae bacterium]
MMRDIAMRILARLPATLRGAFAQGDRATFDRAVEASELFDAQLATDLRALESAAGPEVSSRYALLDRAAREALVDDAADGPAADVTGRDDR